MTFNEQVMSPAQRVALQGMGGVLAEMGLYLAGGTALALLLGHRRSVDLDWFSPEHIDHPEALAAALHAAGIRLTAIRFAKGTIHGLVDGVNVSVFTYPYPLIASAIEWPETSCRLASLPDIAAMKLSAVVGRGSRKDLIDIHALRANGMSLQQMLSCYATKFSTDDVSSVLYSLTYFDDAEEERMPVMLSGTKWSVVKADLTRWVREYAG